MGPLTFLSFKPRNTGSNRLDKHPEKKQMNQILSCGPVLEPLIGIFISAIICLLLFFYAVNRIRKSNYYEDYFKDHAISSKRLQIAALLILALGAFIMLFFILMLLITLIIVRIESN
jgi:hypothetical protein